MKFIRILFVFTSLLSFSDLFSQNTITLTNCTIDSSLIVNGDYKQIINNYQGLSNCQINDILRIELKIDSLTSMLGYLYKSISNEKMLKEEIAKQSLEIALLSYKFNKLKHFNDSVVESRGDSLFVAFIAKRYNQHQENVLKGFWEEYPNFNPMSNLECVALYEKVNRTKCSNIVNAGVPYNKYVTCTNCVRSNPNEWAGILTQGANYYFSGYKSHNYITGPKPLPFSKLRINIPKYGSFSIAKLRLIKSLYDNSIVNRETTILEAMQIHIQDSTLTNEQVFCKSVGYESRNGSLKIINTLDQNQELSITLIDKGGLEIRNWPISAQSFSDNTAISLPAGTYSISYNYDAWNKSSKNINTRLNYCRDTFVELF
jgi:hypothetical protein